MPAAQRWAPSLEVTLLVPGTANPPPHRHNRFRERPGTLGRTPLKASPAGSPGWLGVEEWEGGLEVRSGSRDSAGPQP